MIKGRYVCQVEVDFEYDEDKLNITYGEVCDRLMSDWMERAFQARIAEIFKGGDANITVTRQYADIVEGEQP